MNPKIFVGAAAAALGAVLVGILVAGPVMMAEIPIPAGTTGGQAGDPSASQSVPLRVELDAIEVKKMTDRSASIEVVFTLYNPNPRAVMVQTLSYQLFETVHHSDSLPLLGGQIGTRPGGLVEFGSNYYTLLSESSITLKETTTISNPGQPALWQALEDGTASWHITGDLFYNLSSMTSGQENEIRFEFSR